VAPSFGFDEKEEPTGLPGVTWGGAPWDKAPENLPGSGCSNPKTSCVRPPGPVLGQVVFGPQCLPRPGRGFGNGPPPPPQVKGENSVGLGLVKPGHGCQAAGVMRSFYSFCRFGRLVFFLRLGATGNELPYGRRGKGGPKIRPGGGGGNLGQNRGLEGWAGEKTG